MFFRLLLLALAPAFAGAQIHIGFHNGTFTRDGMTSRPAGAVVNTATTTWNAVVNNGGVGPSFSGFVLRDATGTDTGARLAANSGYTWYNSNGWGSRTQDWVMMEGWYGFSASESLTVTNLPPAYAEGFSVIIYGDSDVTNRTMNYTIGGQTRTIQDAG
ncbi:MAG: hypothetical protein MUF25_21000, partial [Pirellulaceae bacterium]|nr:hypothetical protein [Pirellulaceae bacterium]